MVALLVAVLVVSGYTQTPAPPQPLPADPYVDKQRVVVMTDIPQGHRDDREMTNALAFLAIWPQ
jgi:hypothetical protein